MVQKTTMDKLKDILREKKVAMNDNSRLSRIIQIISGFYKDEKNYVEEKIKGSFRVFLNGMIVGWYYSDFKYEPFPSCQNEDDKVDFITACKFMGLTEET